MVVVELSVTERGNGLGIGLGPMVDPLQKILVQGGVLMLIRFQMLPKQALIFFQFQDRTPLDPVLDAVDSDERLQYGLPVQGYGLRARSDRWPLHHRLIGFGNAAVCDQVLLSEQRNRLLRVLFRHPCCLLLSKSLLSSHWQISFENIPDMHGLYIEIRGVLTPAC